MLKLIIISTAWVTLSTAAMAQSRITVEGAPSARVSYAELNLFSPKGRDVLNGRIHRAAERLCTDDRVRDLRREMAGRDCIAAAVASAQPQIERALAEARDGRRQLAAADRRVVVTLRR
ncbi:MAG: hypothetical protein QOJ94_452 [Sphingomonadales bacterium]|jgi:UrcA family protein|nr:hypothetical protein [Sphingomonadales bacterium]